MADTDSHYSELKSSLSSISVKALNVSSRLTLANNLDSKQVLLSSKNLSRDYRGLAELIGLQYCAIKKLEEFQDRTMKILETWETCPDATLDKLITYLEDMDRHDIIQELIPSLKKNVEAYIKHQKSLESPIQVAEVSSGPVNVSSKKWVITKDDQQSGEYTIYDAYVSYADEDTNIAKEFASILESPQVGLKLFIRGRDMLAGCPELDTNIELIKNRCRRMLIILTPNFIKSPALEFQVSFAGTLAIEQRQRILIPVILTLCEIPPILSSVSKIDFTKQYTHDWMMDKLITSLMPEDRIFLPSTARSQLRSVGNATPNSACSISAESRPVITFPPSAKYSLSSAVQINSNALLSIAPPADILDEDRDSGACSEMYQSAACSEMHQSAACSEMHQSAACSEMHQSAACSEMHQSAACSESKEVLSPPKQSSKKFQQFMSLLKRKGNSTSAPSTSFSSGATSGFHSQSSSNIRSLDNVNDCMDDTSL